MVVSAWTESNNAGIHLKSCVAPLRAATMIRARRPTLILKINSRRTRFPLGFVCGPQSCRQKEGLQIGKKNSSFKSQTSADSINRAGALNLSPRSNSPPALRFFFYLFFFIYFFFTFSLFNCPLHPRIHIETIRFRSNSLLEKTSARAVRRAVNQNYPRFSERRLRAQDQTFSPHPGACLRIRGGRADGSGQSPAVNYRHRRCRLVTHKSKQVDRRIRITSCGNAPVAPPSPPTPTRPLPSKRVIITPASTVRVPLRPWLIKISRQNLY